MEAVAQAVLTIKEGKKGGLSGFGSWGFEFSVSLSLSLFLTVGSWKFVTAIRKGHPSDLGEIWAGSKSHDCIGLDPYLLGTSIRSL